MEIIEKIQLTFDDLDEERLVSIARTCSDLVTRFQIDLAFSGEDQTKLEIIQSKRKEVQDKIKEMAMKAHYAVDLYNQHLNIELKKAFNDQAFNLPLKPDDTSIFKVEILRLGDIEDEYNEVDHVECALTNAQKVCEESIVWTIFYSELEELEQEIQEGMDNDQKDELAETPSSIKEPNEQIQIEKRDETVEPVNVTNLSSKYLQIFKEGGAELFDFFQSEYTIDDHSPVAKYSYIYRFLSEKQFIIARSQTKYMKFIKDTFGVNMSKIFRENYKYRDDIYPILRKLKSDFVKGNKSEMN
ncbi:MAG TPA: hypothetical protein DCL77_17275 [Prolixibacteraceae bacterium]|jgi:hypothetical protein|nr:hypothetical protein [Prolixibacteraceae bacterium]